MALSLTISPSSLLISLRILHRLLTECKRDIGLFARQTMRMVSTALDVHVYGKNDTDLEVASRATACFTAYATYTDGAAIGVDDALTEAYLAVLGKFANLSCYTPPTEKPDTEEQSRARLIGLSALSATAGSDAVLSASVEFPRQVKLIVPALLKIISGADLQELKDLAAKTKAGSDVALFSEFQQARRMSTNRRLPSLHEHVPGEKGPSTEDVAAAAYRCLYHLVSECQINQAEKVLTVVFGFLDKYGWADVERACWLVNQLTAAMMLQSRSVVPTALVDLLLEMPDDVPPMPKHTTVVAMVTTVLSSSVSLVGLGVTDILGSLVAVITRRVTVNANDELLPALVNCVSSLGTHIYYADQINDIVEEITVQMAAIPVGDPARQDILRVLIHCIMGVMSAADVGDEAEARASELRATSPTAERTERLSAAADRTVDKGKGPQLESPGVEIPRHDLGRRNPIAPEVWQETLPLLCESTYAVRAMYVRALLFYLETEMPRDRRPRPDEPNIVRFCNALHASLYTLAMSSRLGVGDPIPSAPPTPSAESPAGTSGTRTPVFETPRSLTPNMAAVEGVPATAPVLTISGPTPGDTPAGSLVKAANGGHWPPQFDPASAPRSTSGTGTPNGRASPPKKGQHRRRVSLPINRLGSSTDLAQFDNVATPFDYAFILRVLDELHKSVPVAALSTGGGMLLALDADAGTELQRATGRHETPGAWVLERKRACRETVAIGWRRIAARWAVTPVVQLADRAIGNLPEPFIVPDMYLPEADVLRPDEPHTFVRDETQGESAAASLPLLDPSAIIDSFSASPRIQDAAGRDASEIRDRLASRWTVEDAIRESFERFHQPAPAPDAAPRSITAIPNESYHSLGRPASRAVDIGDLRDALGGGGAQNSAGTGHTAGSARSVASSGGSASSPERAGVDAAEILKDIFKDKKPSRA